MAVFSRGGFSGLTDLFAICLPTDLSVLTNLGVFTGAECMSISDLTPLDRKELLIGGN